MKELYCPPTKILPREKRAFHNCFPESVRVEDLPPIAAFDVDKDYEFRKCYDIEYVCINGHTRLYTAKKRGLKEVKILVPENLGDLETLVEKGEWLWMLKMTFEENKKWLTGPQKVRDMLKHCGGVENIFEFFDNQHLTKKTSLKK